MTNYLANDGWRHYWHDNRLAACVPQNPASAVAIETHWRDFFANLPDGAAVLDIATGNGVLLVWAAQASRAAGRELRLTGMDLADIDPARFLPEYQADLNTARFVGNTAAESLPFDAGSFDVVVSQYGLEYADLELALAEASRVLAPGGQLHWLAHDEHSIVVAQGCELLQDIDLLLSAQGPFAAMKTYVHARSRRQQVKRATRELTEALRVAQAYCDAKPPATLVRQLCSGILDTANNFDKYLPADIEHWLNENHRRLCDQRQRVSDLQSARLTPERLAQLQQSFSRAPWSEPSFSALNVGFRDDSLGLVIHAGKNLPTDSS